MSPHKTIHTREMGETLVVSVGGYLNSLLGEEVEKVVRAKLEGGGRRILLNFGGTRLVNSIGISFVIGIVEKVMERDGQMVSSPPERNLSLPCQPRTAGVGDWLWHGGPARQPRTCSRCRC